MGAAILWQKTVTPFKFLRAICRYSLTCAHYVEGDQIVLPGWIQFNVILAKHIPKTEVKLRPCQARRDKVRKFEQKRVFGYQLQAKTTSRTLGERD